MRISRFGRVRNRIPVNFGCNLRQRIERFQSSNVGSIPYFPVAATARSTVQVAGLPKDALVEIELVAAL